MTTKDAFDLWWEWAKKPLDSMLLIDGDIHYRVMELSPEDRRHRDKVNEAARQAEQSRDLKVKRPPPTHSAWNHYDAGTLEIVGAPIGLMRIKPRQPVREAARA